MLYEFHRIENKKKANSVHATYLIAGSRYEPESNGIVKDGEDVVMSSQPFQSSPPAPALAIEDDTPILSITLVREEDLEEARKSYESIVSIHVYSLGATKVKDLQILSDANREVLEKYAGQNGAEYGTITNKNVRKRNVSGPRLVPKDEPVPTTKPKAAAQKKDEIKKEESKPKMVAENKADGPSASGPAVEGKSGSNFFGQPSGATAKKDAKISPDESPASSTASKPAAAPAAAALKRGNSGSIFASFAKAKPKEKSESAAAASSAAQSPVISAVADEVMKDVTDEEEEEVAPKPKPRARAAPKKEAVKKETPAERTRREEREKRLRDMMEESDEEPVKSKSTTPAVVAQDDDEEEPEEVAPPKNQKPEPKEYVEISGGRRRGKRRVMKKKTMRDEEGYLGKLNVSTKSTLLWLTHRTVTKEEPAWESFSEDESVAKVKPAPSQAASQKKKPAGAKAGQGSIMSFFAKKT